MESTQIPKDIHWAEIGGIDYPDILRILGFQIAPQFKSRKILHSWAPNRSPQYHNHRVYSFTMSTCAFMIKVNLPSSKLTWQWKITIFTRRYIFKGSIFHCYVSLPECTFETHPAANFSLRYTFRRC